MSNLEYYKVFYTAAYHASLTVAAKELSISQPAVSQTIKLLEEELGAKLFTRVSRGIRLTPEGELLYPFAEQAVKSVEQGERKLQEMLNLDLGEVRIGASDMTLRFYLLPYLEIFHESYPAIKVNVTNAPTPATLELLSKGEIDFGVVSTPFESGENIQAIPVREIEDVFVAGRRFIAYKNRMLDLQELEHMPIISLEQRTSTRSYMDRFLWENGVTLQPEFELATSDMIVQFALRNLGVGSVMKEFAREDLENGKLFELRFNKIIPKRQFCVVTDRKRKLSPAAERVLAIINGDQCERRTE